MPTVVLASTSRYRKRLLERISLPFEAESPDVDESPVQEDSLLSPHEIAAKLAYLKAAAVFSRRSDAIVIGSDQVAVLGNQILTKPGSREHNIAQLEKLSGQTHKLITAVCVLAPGEKREFSNEVVLVVRSLGSEEIERYVDHDEPWDCSGGYRIEGQGVTLFTRVDTSDPSSIEGLPLMQLTATLRELGVQIP